MNFCSPLNLQGKKSGSTKYFVQFRAKIVTVQAHSRQKVLMAPENGSWKFPCAIAMESNATTPRTR
jgi:hypothetical protein